MNSNSIAQRVLRRLFLLVLVAGVGISLASAQNVVTGKVTSKDDGSVMPGVNIILKGTQVGTTTNANGMYSIEVTGANPILVFSFVGYNQEDVPVNSRSVIDFVITPSAENLKEVVVTALGISREKKSLAYSVAEVKSEDLVKASNPSLMKSLDGKVSGVNFTNLSSDPTSSVLVNIRGTSTMPTTSSGGTNISLNSQPLYVIDGIQVGSQSTTSKDGVDFGNILSQLNPNDIASVTILKGGSAGALYGAEGGNGVVMITTKSGRGGKKGLGVSYSTSFSQEKAYQFIQEQTEFGQGERANEWQYDNTDTWGPKLDGSFSANYWDVKNKKWANGPMTSSKENRVQAYLQTGHTWNNSVAVTGNSDRGAFRLGISNMTNVGVMPNTKTEQKSFTLNTDYNLTKKIKVSVSSSYIHTYSPNKQNTTGSNSVLNNLLFNLPTNLQPLADMKDYWLTGFEGIKQNGSIMKDNGVAVSNDNPWFTTYEKLHRFTRDNFFGKIQLNWQLSDNFSLLARTGMENVKEAYEMRQSWGAKDDPFGGYVTGNNSSIETNSDVILTYNKNIGRLSVNASVGGNYHFNNSNSSEITAGDLNSPGLFTVANAKSGTLTPSPDNNWPFKVLPSQSVYAMATFGWDDKFFLDVTGRNDWKGNLREEKIHYFYPSASLSWVASESIHFPEVFTLVKPRINIADVGNGLVKQRSVDTYTYDASPWGAANTVSLTSSLVDRNIKTQHSITKEAGIDLWMFKGRVKFDFTYFIKTQKDQIGSIALVPGTGYKGMMTNIGDVTNKGVEWGLNLTPIKTKDFSWDISASFTHYLAKITRLSEQFAPNGYVFADYDGKTTVKIAKGEQIGGIYEQNPILRVKEGQYKGMMLLSSDAGKVQLSSDERDRGKLGNFNPDFILGINTTLKYKQFSLGIVGSLRQGGKYVSVNQQYLESNGRAETTLGSGPNNPYWVGGRDAAHGGLPWPVVGSSTYAAINNNNDSKRSSNQDAVYVKGVFVNPNHAGSDAVTDADYIVNGADKNNTFYDFPYNGYGDIIWDFASTRTYSATNFKLRELSFAYSVPGTITQKYFLNNLMLSVYGRNLFQWNASGRHEDPESAFSGVGTSQGILRATLPSIRSYGFKVSVDF